MRTSARAHRPSHPGSPSSNHHDISTFLEHARSTSLSPTSTVHVGTSYEYLCSYVLLRLGFTLARTGGRSDRGIDLLGLWVLPSRDPSIGSSHCVLVQCKARKAKPNPVWIRELEGAVAGAPGEWRADNTVGVLCAKQGATEGVREAVRRAKRGIIWIMVEDLNDDEREEQQQRRTGTERAMTGRVRQVLWNDKVTKLVGLQVGTGVRYVPGKKGMDKEVVIMLDGEAWEPDVKTNDDDR